MAIAAVMLCVGATAASAATLHVQEWRVTNDLTNHGNPSLADWPSISGNRVVWDTGGGSGSEASYSVLDPMVAPGAGTQPLQGNNEGAWTLSTPCVFASGSANTYVWAVDYGSESIGPEIDTWRDTSEGVSTLVPASSGGPCWPVISGDWVVWSDSSSGDLLAAPWSDAPIESSTTLYNGGIVYSTDVSPSSLGTIAVWGDVQWVGSPPDLHTRAISYYRNLDVSGASPVRIGPLDLSLEQSDARISGNTVVYEQCLRVGNSWENNGIWTENLVTGERTQVVDSTGLPVHPDISGDWVVWESGPLGQTRVYAKNITTGVTGPVSPAGVSAQGPRIDGDIVVWVDGRDWETTGNTTEIYAAQLSEAVVDTTPPVTTASGWDQGNHYPGPVKVTLTAIDPAGAAGDPVSGVASTWYSIDEPNPEFWTPYDGPFDVNGYVDHTVYFYSVDKAGNPEDVKSAKVLISTSAPSIDLPSPDAPTQAERDLYDTQPLSSDPALAEQNSSMMGDSTLRFSVPGTTNPNQVTVRWAKVNGSVTPDLSAAPWALAAKQFDTVSNEFTAQFKCTETGLHAVWIHAVTPAGVSDVIRYYYVNYLSSGLQQPVNLDCTSIFNGSSTIPLKVQILDANRQPVTGIAPKLTVLALHSGAAGSVAESVVNVTAYVDPDDFKYMGNGVWQLNWSAKKNLVGLIPPSWSSATIRFSVSFTHSPTTRTSTDVSLTRCKG